MFPRLGASHPARASQPHCLTSIPTGPPPAAEPLQADNLLAGLRVINTANEGSVSGAPVGTSGTPGGPQLTATVPDPERPSKLRVGLTLDGERQVGRRNVVTVVCCCCLLLLPAAAALPPIKLQLSPPPPPGPCSFRVALTGLSLQARVMILLSAQAMLMTGPSLVGVRRGPAGMVGVPRGPSTHGSAMCRPTTWDCGWSLGSLSTPPTPR